MQGRLGDPNIQVVDTRASFPGGHIPGAVPLLTGIGAPPYDAPTIQLVDARTTGEYASGHIPSAVLQPWPTNLTTGVLLPRAALEALYDAHGFDPATPTVTYCLVGWRASVAWVALRWLGYEDARVYDGPWLEWGAGGFPVEP